MDKAIDKVVKSDKMDMTTPEEVSSVTSAVLEATAHTAKMTDEMIQLSEALDKLEERNKIFRSARNKAKSKMQNIIVNL